MTDDATAVLCELASLHALGVLDSDEAVQFDRHLVEGCNACRRELERMRFTVDLLALAPAPVEPPPSLRGRLLDAVRQSAEPARPAFEFENEGEWKPYSAPGIEFRVLNFDRSAREIVMLVRAAAGARYPLHGHAAQEDMFMLRGDLAIDGKTYGPGDFIRSRPGTRHGVGDTASGCMFLMRGSVDDLVFAENGAGDVADSSTRVR